MNNVLTCTQQSTPVSSLALAGGLAVAIVRTEADLIDACHVRQVGYGHHLGDDTSGFATIEALDRTPGTVVFVCRDQRTGEAVGTVRIQPGQSRSPLQIERHVILPYRVTSRVRAEVTRLAVLPGADAQVKLCLMRAVYQHALAHGIDWLVIAARNDALARNYRRLGFKDFLAPGQMLPLPCAGNLPHYIFTMDVQGVCGEWQRSGHRLLGFMLDGAYPRQEADAHSRSRLPFEVQQQPQRA